MKLHPILEIENTLGLSTAEQSQRLENLFSTRPDENRYKKLYYWVRQGKISPLEFMELIQWITKE